MLHTEPPYSNYGTKIFGCRPAELRLDTYFQLTANVQEEKDNEVEADNKESSNSDNSSKTKENLNDHQMFLIIFIPNEETFNDLDPSGEALADINEVGDDQHETDLLPALIIAGSCFILIVTILKCFVFKSS